MNSLLRVVLAASLVSVAGAGELEWEQVLRRVSAKVDADLRSVQKYTCVETVHRNYFRPWAATLPRACPVLLELRQHPTLDLLLKLTTTDRLRLDVTSASGGEVHSWAGASRFEEEGIDRVVREGPIGTGSFGALLSVIFQTDVRKFSFLGESTVDGRRRLRYSFEVPAGASHYRVKIADATGWATTGYSGEVMVDPETADPVQLMVRTQDVPPATKVCQTEATLHFGRVAIGGSHLLLPNRAVQRFIYPDGKEVENTMAFSGCREYTSESSVRFLPVSESGTAGGAATVTAGAPDIPQGLRFKLEMAAPVDSDTAAAGDRFTARLSEALRDGKRVLAPKGALVEGRISAVQINHRPKQDVIFGLSPETVQIRGSKVPIAANLDVRTLALARQSDRKKGIEIYLPPPGEHYGIIALPGPHAVLRRGFLSEWVTIPRGNP